MTDPKTDGVTSKRSRFQLKVSWHMKKQEDLNPNEREIGACTFMTLILELFDKDFKLIIIKLF